jgi:prevent-host-death family protein
MAIARPKPSKANAASSDGLSREQTSVTRLASRTVSVAEAKKGFSELCARAGYARETIVVTKHGRPIAAIIGIEDLERAAALEDRRAVELIERAIATSRGTVKVDPSSVL